MVNLEGANGGGGKWGGGQANFSWGGGHGGPTPPCHLHK